MRGSVTTEDFLNYFVLDFSGTNATAPRRKDIEALREAGVELSYEYGMSYSRNPGAALDLYYNARTELTEEELRQKLASFPHPPLITPSDPRRVTIRGCTVEHELNAMPR